MPSTSATPGQPDYTGETDDDLLVYMSWRETDDQVACAALAELYRRHVRYIYAAVNKAYGFVLSPDEINGLVKDTFQRALVKAKTFKPSGLQDRDRMRRRVLGWLSVIAKNLAREVLRGREQKPEETILPERWAELPARNSTPELSDEERMVREAMEEVLNDREQDVLRVTLFYYDPGREHQRLPDDVAADLAARLGTTPDNLRKIRATAMAKMTAHLQARLPVNHPLRHRDVAKP